MSAFWFSMAELNAQGIPLERIDLGYYKTKTSWNGQVYTIHWDEDLGYLNPFRSLALREKSARNQLFDTVFELIQLPILGKKPETLSGLSQALLATIQPVLKARIDLLIRDGTVVVHGESTSPQQLLKLSGRTFNVIRVENDVWVVFTKNPNQERLVRNCGGQDSLTQYLLIQHILGSFGSEDSE